jgi:hypothetical protein
MSGWKIEFLLIGIILLIGVASAVMPNKITITSSADSDSHNGWLVANGVDQTTITIKVENNSLSPPPTWEPVDLANVILSVDPLYGSLTDLNLVTNGVGEATTVFRANKTPIDNLFLNVTASNTEGTTSSTKIIKIDHDQAYYAYFEYKDEVVIDQTTPFVVTLKDRWGNRVDNKNPNKIHIVKLHIYPPPGGLGTGGFLNGTVYSPYILGVTDIQGNISLTAKVDTVAGENNIWMERIESVPDQYPFIVGIAESVPFTIDQEFDPTAVPNPFVPADNDKKFTIKYTLHDQFGNPAGNQSVYISTSIGENLGNITTNSIGEIWVTYGPRSTSVNVNITAIALANTSVSCFQTVEFRSTAPINMLVSANPETMPSRDVKSDMVADIKAKVMDISGNPVAGQVVTFSLGAPSYDGTYNITGLPSLVSASATSDADGYGTVQFAPGSFSTDPSALHYSETATGSAIVTATWITPTNTTQTQSVTVYWKNYPYLSVKTYVVPQSVALNETFDVTIELYGDGYKMVQHPIDVMLTFDRSGSMAGTPLTDAKTAARSFVDQMNVTRDKVGLFAFSDTFLLRNSLTNSFSSVKTNINALTASGNTGTRRALKESIDNVIANRNPDPKSVQAIVLETDGAYNIYADPLARGTGVTTTGGCGDGCTSQHYYFTGLGGVTGVSGANRFTDQNMSRYASENNIRVYSISFGSGIPVGSSMWNTLETLSNATGAKHFHAATGADLLAMYTLIAGELKTSAGVNTTMQLKFDNVSINNVSVPGGNAFNYSYVPGTSTHITNNTYDGTIDQTADWNDDHNLYFDIGTVHLQETWRGTFRLRAIYAQGGNVNIFGDNSIISFNNNEATLKMPQTWVTIIPNLTNIGINSTTLDLSNLHSTAPGVIKDFIPLEWQINYNGNETVTERVSYSNTGGNTWVLFDTNYITKGVFTDYSSLDVRLLPPGEYWIRVDASAPDAPNDREELVAPVTVGTSGRSYIKLE